MRKSGRKEKLRKVSQPTPLINSVGQAWQSNLDPYCPPALLKAYGAVMHFISSLFLDLLGFPPPPPPILPAQYPEREPSTNRVSPEEPMTWSLFYRSLQTHESTDPSAATHLLLAQIIEGRSELGCGIHLIGLKYWNWPGFMAIVPLNEVHLELSLQPDPALTDVPQPTDPTALPPHRHNAGGLSPTTPSTMTIWTELYQQRNLSLQCNNGCQERERTGEEERV